MDNLEYLTKKIERRDKRIAELEIESEIWKDVAECNLKAWQQLQAQVEKDFEAICSIDIDAMGIVPEAHDCPAYPIREQYLHEMCASMRKIGIELIAAIKGE